MRSEQFDGRTLRSAVRQVCRTASKRRRCKNGDACDRILVQIENQQMNVADMLNAIVDVGRQLDQLYGRSRAAEDDLKRNALALALSAVDPLIRAIRNAGTVFRRPGHDPAAAVEAVGGLMQDALRVMQSIQELRRADLQAAPLEKLFYGFMDDLRALQAHMNVLDNQWRALGCGR